jgi:hypothetical protein
MVLMVKIISRQTTPKVDWILNRKKERVTQALLIPQEVDNTKNTVYADAQSHQEIGTKDSKDAPLQSLGIDGIGKSLLNLAKREVYVRFIPY